MKKQEEFMNALGRLYLEVPNIIADDIKQKAMAALDEAKGLTDNGWIKFEGNSAEFNKRILIDGDCLVKFDNGEVMKYSEEHPMAVLTHFK